MKRYKFQALVTPGPAAGGGLAALPPGQIRRMVVRGQHHETQGSQFFSALVADNGDGSGWLADDHVIVTIAVTADDPRAYFGIGDHFALWLGSDIADGVVTRRLYI
jgi:hypothetical protein